ncbi:trypsin-like peptidase domain-containing protein [Mongoliitalea lutea]|uniref:Trypsin-like peptidase domain-containing protein n=1 Tax=Mongoliitalea lutea TaxID=849756 RepID=A0A8J3G7V6_9BACT|nr:trypsin-like peptidase domain-containing protein [Mongoliitalea lutea]GHB52979.1 hypothetical protein GCM10008106_36930 [Mongoliitalea lutea]
MFVEAIQKVAGFTRAIHTISRTYASNQVIPGAATLFFVNELGVAITCKHVIQWLAQGRTLQSRYQEFAAKKRVTKHPKKIKELEVAYRFKEHSIIQMKTTFVDCVDRMSGYTWHLHPTYDLAILKFNDIGRTLYQGHAVFGKSGQEINQGSYLCRLGFPFPEFTNYTFSEAQDDIVWTAEGTKASPRFPIEGMLTRFVADKNGVKYGIEMSTPGLRGQSGGPLFGTNGLIYGMQSRTKHLHLGFDIEEKQIMSNGKLKNVSDYSFIHLGECIHMDIIKDFLKMHQIKFYEA